MKPAIRWDSLSWPTGFHSGVRTWHCPTKWNDSRRLLKEHKMKSPQTTLKIHQPSPQSPHVWFLYPLWQIFVFPRVSPMAMSADVCCQCVARGIPWQSTARQHPAAVGSADRARHSMLRCPSSRWSWTCRVHRCWAPASRRHPGPRAIPGHPVVAVVFFHVKDGEKPGNLGGWRNVDTW